MRNGRGFTLIELLIVVVIIGILAAITIPKYANTREKAYIASMKADLRNLVTAQEAYFADHVTYATTVTNLAYNTTLGNTVSIVQATGTGWSATSTTNGSLRTCGIFVGSATPPVAGEPEGSPTCP